MDDRKRELLRGAVYGFAVGDALGVPFEMYERGSFCCTGMTGYGTWDKPVGTWSDDTAMMLATLHSLKMNSWRIDLYGIMMQFQDWYHHGKYAIDGDVFGVGKTVSAALSGFDGVSPVCGIDDIRQNGNGALMRILPLAFAVDADDDKIAQVAEITHGHAISTGCCIRYVHIARSFMDGSYPELPYSLPIRSSAYVADAFNAVMYCISSSCTYKDSVLKAVNLGGDTDTIAALTGGLAGIIYGSDGIPSEWIDALRGRNLIEECLC